MLNRDFSPTGGKWDGEEPYDYRHHAETEGVEYFMYKGKRNDAGQAHGIGIGVYRDGTVYEGYYFRDKRHGLGKSRAKGERASTYTGDFFDDVKQGRGVLTDHKGKTVYQGKFIDNYPARGPLKYKEDRYVDI